MIVDGNKYIQFELMDAPTLTQHWNVVNKRSGSILGIILWYSGWRQYVFRPSSDTEYNNGCLDAISTFLTRLNKEKKIQSA